MDIRLIRAFVTLAQLRRYHAAAERLCLTQPALTKQIQTLEHLTGMTLFQRGRQGAQLTAAGEAIYSQACHFVAQHDQFCAWTEQVRRGNVGTLALGFGISTFQLAPAQVKAFRQQFPDIEVSLNDIASHEQYRMLLEGQLHAGFVRMPVPEALEARALMEESLVLAVPAGATEALPDIASVLRQFPLLQINPRRGRGLAEQTAHFLQINRLSADIVADADDIHTLLALVAAGNGVALLPAGACHLLPAGIKLVTVTGEGTQWQVGLAWNPQVADAVRDRFIAMVCRKNGEIPPR
ncbi:LysR family transcriptional regulator [Raoultella ornithinolytica]|uniref:LysR substrate-binding domain-containing protein n=1 Tax=Raoultella ornithinolytica TaxID=54291 RepID=UPI00403DA778